MAPKTIYIIGADESDQQYLTHHFVWVDKAALGDIVHADAITVVPPMGFPPSLRYRDPYQFTVKQFTYYRSGPGFSYPSMGGVEPGTVIDVKKGNRNNDWFLTTDGYWIDAVATNYDPDTAFLWLEVIDDEDIPPTPTSTPTAEPALDPLAPQGVVIRNTNLRMGPGPEFDKGPAMTIGTPVYIDGITLDGDWYLLPRGWWIATKDMGNVTGTLLLVDDPQYTLVEPTQTPATATPLPPTPTPTRVPPTSTPLPPTPTARLCDPSYPALR